MLDDLKQTLTRNLGRLKVRAASAVVPSRIAIWHGSRQQRVLALTFDDGPDELTPELLEVLRDLGVRATFFVVGQRVYKHPEIVKQVAEAGHELGNHSFTHNDYEIGPLTDARAEIAKTNQAIRSVTGRTPSLFRPPFGELSREVVVAAWRAGMTMTMWSFDTEDWRDEPPAAGRLERARPGDIVLLHDDNRNAPRIVQEQVPPLREAGYRFVTVSELLRP